MILYNYILIQGAGDRQLPDQDKTLIDLVKWISWLLIQLFDPNLFSVRKHRKLINFSEMCAKKPLFSCHTTTIWSLGSNWKPGTNHPKDPIFLARGHLSHLTQPIWSPREQTQGVKLGYSKIANYTVCPKLFGTPKMYQNGLQMSKYCAQLPPHTRLYIHDRPQILKSPYGYTQGPKFIVFQNARIQNIFEDVKKTYLKFNQITMRHAYNGEELFFEQNK